MIKKLSAMAGSRSFDIFPYITMCTLDIICGKQFKSFTRFYVLFTFHLITFLICFQCVINNLEYLVLSFYRTDSAMGKYVRAQDNNDSEYVRAIYK